MNYTDNGNIEIADADDANIPVGITLIRTKAEDIRDDGDAVEGEWTLLADCYQPRRNSCQSCAFNASSMDRDALAKVVREKWLPLYRSAFAQVEELASSSNHEDDSLNYWTPIEASEPGRS